MEHTAIKDYRQRHQLIWAIVLMSVVAAIVGLVAQTVYQDNAFVKSAWHANDWVTVLVVLPAIVVAMQKSSHSMKAQLISMGLLSYLFYNYAFYLFGATFNKLFLVYVGIVSLTSVVLIKELIALPVQKITINAKAIRWVCTYLVIIVLMLCAIEIVPSIQFIVTGDIPQIVKTSGNPTSIVYALDLIIVVPLSVFATIWLWKLRTWGVVAAAIMLVKGITYGLVLCAGTILLNVQGIASDPLLPFYVFIAVGGVIGLIWLMRHVTIKN